MKKRKLVSLIAIASFSVNVYAQSQIDFGINENRSPDNIGFENIGQQIKNSPQQIKNMQGQLQNAQDQVRNAQEFVGDVQEGVQKATDMVDQVNEWADDAQGLQKSIEAVQKILQQIKAGFPQIDFAGIVAAIVSTLIKVMNIEAKKQINELELKAKEELGKLTMENLQKAAASAIENIQKQMIDEQNKKLAEQMSASPIICEQVANSVMAQNSTCISQEVARNITDTRSYAAYVQENDVVKEQEARKLLYNIEKSNPELFGRESAEDISKPAPEVYAINGTPLMSNSEAYKALDNESYEAMKNLISLIVPDPSMSSIPDQLSNYDDFDMNGLMSSEARKNLAKQSLLVNLGLRASKSSIFSKITNVPTSRLYELNHSISSSVSESAIYKISIGETSTPTKLYRTQLLNLLRSLELQLEEFKGQLRLEATIATKLASKIEE